MHIKKGDTVQAISGASRGKKGKVIKVLDKGARVTVEGLNMRKKHTRPKKQGQTGQIIEFPAPVHASKVMLVCQKCDKATRAGMHIAAGEKKRRVCKKCKQFID